MRATWIVLAALLALVPGIATPAVFDDGNDRAFVKDLSRKKNPDELDRAILKAARKVGAVNLCNRDLGGNAVVIRHTSCKSGSAIAFSAHFFINKKAGKLKCASWKEVMKGSRYFPNASFYDTKNPNKNKKFIYQEVGLIFPPLNWDDLRDEKISDPEDMAIFCLTRDVSKDVMPDGSKRGYFKFSQAEPGNGDLSMIGVVSDMGAKLDMVYQKNCDGFLRYGKLYHGCDETFGASASAITILEDGEMKLRAINTSGYNKTYSKADAEDPNKANVGTPVEYILDLESRGILPKSPL